MGIRLNNKVAEENTVENKPSESLEQGIELSTSNPAPEPVEVEEPVAEVDRTPAALSNKDLDAATSFAVEPEATADTFSNEDLDEATDYAINEPMNAIEQSRVLSRGVDDNRIRHLKEVQEIYKVTPDEAMGLLAQYPYEELKSRPKFRNITHDYPAVAKFSQKPENMKLVQKDPEAFKKLEESSKMLSYLGDFGKVAMQNAYTVPMMGLHAAIATGTVSVNDAAPLMEKLEAGINANQISYNRKGMQEIGTGMNKLTKGLNKIFPYKFSDSKGDVTLDSLSNVVKKIDVAASNKDWGALTRMYKRFQNTDTGLLDFLGSVLTNPSAATLMAGQSAYSIAPGFVAPIAGAAAGGALGGPVGAGIGAAGAAATAGFAVSYAQFFQEESDKFKNPKTGKVDFRKMYSDPAVVSKMNGMALKYASAHAVFEAVGGKLLGKTFHGAKAASAGSKVLALGVETLEQATSEGMGETFAQAMTGKSIGDSLSQGAAEAVFSVPYAPGAAVIQAMNLARINANEKKKGGPGPSGDVEVKKPAPVFNSKNDVFKVIGEKLEAQKALKNKEIVTEMREQKQASPALKESPQQVQELIKEATNPTAEVGVHEDGTVIEDTIGEDTRISFDVSQFEELAEKVGEDPLRMAEHLGPNGVEAYIAAKKSETGVFQVTADEYHRYSDNRPELDDIMYVNDTQMNAVEGQQTVEAAQELEKHLLDSVDLNDEMDSDEPPPIAGADFAVGEEDNSFTVYEPSTGDESLGDNISRPVELINAARPKEERVAFANVLRKMKAALKNSPAPEGMAEAMAGVQLSHLRFRAEATGVSIGDLESNIGIGYSSKLDGNILGMMRAPEGYTSQILKVVFGPKSEASTVIHEFAHSWLHSMILDYPTVSNNLSRTAVQEDYYQAMLQVEKMFDLESLNDIYKMPDSGSRAIHETFAQTAESYFLNGDMQNNGMRRIFEQIKSWMTEVASMINRLTRGYPTLKLNPEIERMFRTILDADRNAEERTSEMFPEPLFTADVVGDKAEKYTKAIKDARDEAVARMYSKFFNESLREREKKIDAALDDIYNQAVNEVNELPAIMLHDLIKARGADAKITYQSILDHLAKGDVEVMEQIKEMLAPGVMAPNKRRGVDVREVMDAMNVHDPEEFISMLGQMKMKDTLVDQRAQQLVDETFPALKTDTEMHQEAVKSIQESGREKILDLELDILAEKHMGTLRQMNESAVKSPFNLKRKSMQELGKLALNNVMGTSVARFKPGSFLAQATKFNKQAASFVRQGDYLAAFDVKQKEAIHSFAFLEGLKAAKALEKVASNIKKLNKLSPKDIGKNFDFDIYTATKHYVEEFSRGALLSDPSEFEGYGAMSEVSKIAATRLVNVINEDIASRPDGDKSVKMTLNLGELVDIMRKSAREAKTVEINDKKTDRKEIIQGILAETQGTGVLRFDQKARYKYRTGIVQVDNLFAGLMTEAKFAGSNILNSVLAPVRAGENEVIFHRDTDEKILSDAIKKISKNNPEAQGIMRMLKDNAYAFFGVEVGKPVSAPELRRIKSSDLGHTFSNKGEVLKLMAIMMSEDGRAKIASGGIKSKGKGNIGTGPLDITSVDEMLNRMMNDGTIIKEDVEFVQTVLDLFQKHYPKLKESIRKVDGLDIGYIEPRKFSTPWGDFKGGYIPLKRGEEMAETLSKAVNAIDNDNQFVGQFQVVTNTSMRNERGDGGYPVSLDLSTLKSELSAVYRAAYLRPAMVEISKIIGDKDFVRMLETRRPGALNAVILPWLKKTMAQQYVERIAADKTVFQPLEKIVQVLTNRARSGIFIANYFTWAKQYIGLVPAAANLPKGHLANAALTSMISPIGTKANIERVSPLMKERFDMNARNVLRSLEDFSLNDTATDRAAATLDKITYAPIQFFQNHVDMMVWTAAYDTATKDLKLDDKKAINYADNYVVRTQTTNNVSGMPTLRTGNVLMKAFTTFSNVPIGMAGLQLEARGRGKEVSNTRAAGILLNGYMMTAIFPALLAAVVGGIGSAKALIGDDDDEREKYLTDMALRGTAESLDSLFPIVAQNIAGLYGGYSGNTQYAQVGVMPLSSQVLSGAKGVGSVIGRGISLAEIGERDDAFMFELMMRKSMGNEEFSNKDLRDMTVAFALMTGIPVSAIPFTFKRVEKTAPEIDYDELLKDIDLGE